MSFIGLPLLLLALVVWNAVHVVREYERLVIFRLGRLWGTKGPGIVLVLPIIDTAVRLDMRTVTMDVPAQDVITRDNVSVKVNAVLYFRVVHPERAVTEVENYLFATSQNAQTTLRSVCGEVDLDDLLGERQKVNNQVQDIIDLHTDPWGIKVVQVAIKHIDLPDEMRRAMARQAEAERERRAKVISAEGEFQASQRLADASAIMAREPIALQLRYLQTLAEIATENNSTTVFPIPMDLLRPFLKEVGKSGTSD
jgi:regulator of protease activity HflC (stomatin/prohibitin superfamily)